MIEEIRGILNAHINADERVLFVCEDENEEECSRWLWIHGTTNEYVAGFGIDEGFLTIIPWSKIKLFVINQEYADADESLDISE